MELCDNLNSHYNNQPFLVKTDHFSGYKVTGICQEKKMLVFESEPIKRLLSEISHRIEDAVEKEKFVTLFCSSGIIQIDRRRLSLGKITYFKDVIILFDGLDEIVCHDYNQLFVNAGICNGEVLLPSSFVV